jgi:hypothetical protein
VIYHSLKLPFSRTDEKLMAFAELVRYEAVNAMLLNEFLKEHRKVEQHDRKLEQQEATITEQQKAD